MPAAPPLLPPLSIRLEICNSNDADHGGDENNSSVASTLFPLFASYKALKTADPAELTPWLMYWVVLACVLLVESWTGWLLVW